MPKVHTVRPARARLAAAALVAGLTLAAAAPTPAMAQDDEALVPTAPTMPRPRFADKPPVLVNMILAVLLGAAVAAPNFIPSKRGHQD